MIKNIDIPSCRNCIHYKPSFYSDYASISSTCEYFGTKDIRTSFYLTMIICSNIYNNIKNE